MKSIEQEVEKAIAKLRKLGPTTASGDGDPVYVRFSAFKSLQEFLDHLLTLRNMLLAKGYKELSWDDSEFAGGGVEGFVVRGVRPETPEEFEKRLEDHKNWLMQCHKNSSSILETQKDKKLRSAAAILRKNGYKVTRPRKSA